VAVLALQVERAAAGQLARRLLERGRQIGHRSDIDG
jgi:hypothetical protein